MKKIIFFTLGFLALMQVVQSCNIGSPRKEGKAEIYDITTTTNRNCTINSDQKDKNTLTIKNRTKHKVYARVADRSDYQCKTASAFILNPDQKVTLERSSLCSPGRITAHTLVNGSQKGQDFSAFTTNAILSGHHRWDLIDNNGKLTVDYLGVKTTLKSVQVKDGKVCQKRQFSGCEFHSTLVGWQRPDGFITKDD